MYNTQYKDCRELGMYPILFKKISCFQVSHLKSLDDDEKHMFTDKRKLALTRG